MTEGWKKAEGHYSKRDSEPVRHDRQSGDKGANSGKQLNIDVLDADAKKNGSARLPRSAK